MKSPKARILVVDDEEAILETMAFTFEDEYEVLTALSARKALELLDRHAPVAAVITDQRMPEMTGVEFLARVFEAHPHAVRIILTGFADMDAIITAINDGHVYAYITKPWEPEHLKHVVRRAVDLHRLTCENERLLTDLRQAKVFLEAVMDHLETGALAVDAAGVVRAANRPMRAFLGLAGDPRGRPLKEALSEAGVTGLPAIALEPSAERSEGDHETVVTIGGRRLRLRIRVQSLSDTGGHPIGRVILVAEISHEPLQRHVEELLETLLGAADDLRPRIDRVEPELRRIVEQARASSVASPGMAALVERASRALTALDHWRAVDDALASEDYPDAQLLRERMRVAQARWPVSDRVPERAQELLLRVEAYYESGENPKRRVL